MTEYSTMKPITLAIFLFIVSGFSVNSFAIEQKWYSVELIVFQQDVSKGTKEEIWPFLENIKLDPGSVDLLPAETTSATNINAPVPLPTPYSKTPLQSLKLTEIAQKLANDQNYQVLVHTGWRQPVIANKASLPVLISDEDSNKAFQELAPLPEQTTNPTPEPTPEESMLIELEKENEKVEIKPEDFPAYFVYPHMTENDNINSKWALRQTTIPVGELPEKFRPRNPMGPPELQVYGTVSLKLGRYLHLEIDLFDRPRLVEPQAIKTEAEFPMQQSEGAAIALTPGTITANNKLIELAGFETHVMDFRLKDSRRIQTQQIYYFDHPLFGVIALVKDYEPDADNI